MLTLDAFEIFIPDQRVLINDLEVQTGLTKEMLSIFQLFYGLRTISVWDNKFEYLLEKPFEKLLKNNNNKSTIKYLIYVHTASFISHSESHNLETMKNKYALDKCLAFEMSMYKCVSYFKALEILSTILSGSDDSAIIVTGEVAFTPKLRVVPNSTLVGDAATASLFSHGGTDHCLLSVSNKIIVGYEKGIYLTNIELKTFDSLFINKMVDIILEVIAKANLTCNDIAIILPHNVNIPTWKKISAALRFSLEKVYLDNIAKLGHCFCSDHLINLQSAMLDHRIKKGDYYVMAGCGLGFFISAAVFKC